MKKSKKRKANENKNALPYSVYVAAMNGDIEAINAVVNHYESYITILSARKLYDERGNIHLCVDNALRQRLRTKLIIAILKFKTA